MKEHMQITMNNKGKRKRDETDMKQLRQHYDRQREEQRETWWQGWQQVSCSTGQHVTQHEQNKDTANLEVHCNTD